MSERDKNTVFFVFIIAVVSMVAVMVLDFSISRAASLFLAMLPSVLYMKWRESRVNPMPADVVLVCVLAMLLGKSLPIVATMIF